jgi:hypothetical protein
MHSVVHNLYIKIGMWGYHSGADEDSVLWDAGYSTLTGKQVQWEMSQRPSRPETMLKYPIWTITGL